MPFQQNRAAETSRPGVPRLSCSPPQMDGHKHRVGILPPVLSDGRAGACCLPRATVQAERKAAPSVLGCQLVPQHWNRGVRVRQGGKGDLIASYGTGNQQLCSEPAAKERPPKANEAAVLRWR